MLDFKHNKRFVINNIVNKSLELGFRFENHIHRWTDSKENDQWFILELLPFQTNFGEKFHLTIELSSSPSKDICEITYQGRKESKITTQKKGWFLKTKSEIVTTVERDDERYFYPFVQDCESLELYDSRKYSFIRDRCSEGRTFFNLQEFINKIKESCSDETLKIDSISSLLTLFEKDSKYWITAFHIEEEKKQKFLNDLVSDKTINMMIFEDESFSELLRINQPKIFEKDKSYIKNFVRLKNYIEIKQKDIIALIKEIDSSSRIEYTDELIEILSSQVDYLKLLFIHSHSMLTAFLNDDLVTFYEISESFDKFGVWNSKWEDDMTEGLNNITERLDIIRNELVVLEQSLMRGLRSLKYQQQDSFRELSNIIQSELTGIKSKLSFQNIFTSINTYQLYKMRKSIKNIS